MSTLHEDYFRYLSKNAMPKFQYFFRKVQNTNSSFLKRIYIRLYNYYAFMNHIEISPQTQIGGGLYIGHPHGIIINSHAILGKNVNIHQNVIIGAENRGERRGTPVIGNNVWIGINTAIVGNVKIGDDVLIAPNSYVNCNVPSHSVVFGNPCIIKHSDHATEGYVNRAVRID